MRKNIVKEKSFAFALDVVKMHKVLSVEKREWVLSKQMLRSGTAIGALIRGSERAESKKDFIHKMSISLKEANETEYWIELLYQSDYISVKEYEDLISECGDLNRIVIAIVRSSIDSLS